MTLNRPVKVGDRLWCYGAIDSQVTITEESMKAQESNPTPEFSMFIDHDGELKEVSQRLLYFYTMPSPNGFIETNERQEIAEELRKEGIM
jgi:hypothetical protein